MARYAALVGIALAAGVGALPAAAQNGFSFLDADSSAVKYRVVTTAPRTACKDLRGLGGRQVTILSAEPVAASEGAPEFCRVLGIIAPEIRFEVALPSVWNRRLYMRGNGGFAGEALDAAPRIAQRDAALRNGFAAAQTDTGHRAAGEPLGAFAADYQKTVDYAFRAVHETAQAAKRITRAYYDRSAAYSYFDGCSTGGRQGLMSAQRFPGDFDGIVVGAPVLNIVDTFLWSAWNARTLDRSPVPLAKMSLVGEAVFKKCDALDGTTDGLIDDPRQCKFDPATDLPKCAAGDGPDCFTAAQINSLKTIYGGMVSNGQPQFFGQLAGAEKAGADFITLRGKVSGWDEWIIGRTGPSRHWLYSEAFLRYMAFGRPDPAYDIRKFDYDKDLPRLTEIRRLLNAQDPDLSEFKARGGRILMYFGWADTALSPLMGIDYYEKVTAKMGPSTRDFYRLFMVAGMFHCRGGFGPDRLDALTPLINWVENGAAPERIVAAQVDDGKITRTRPLCPYPQVARRSGSGGLDDAASFSCQAP